MNSFRAVEYARTGFNHQGRMHHGVVAYVLYTLGYVRYHLVRWFA